MTYSYYSPGSGTVPNPQPLGMPPGPAVCAGEPINVVVACDLGRAIVGIVDGQEAWRVNYPNHWPRAIEIFEGLLYVGIGGRIYAFNPKTGFMHREIVIPNPPANIVGLRITRWNGSEPHVACTFDLNGAGSVAVYTLSEMTLTTVFVNPQIAIHPRCAEWLGGWVFVCDTFRHLFYAVDVASGGAWRVSTEIYYPNYVQMISVEEALITEEHSNRIVRWKYTDPESFIVECAAPVAPYGDPSKRVADIMAAENGTLYPDSAFTPKKSLCSDEAQGAKLTLYSPNSARLYGDDLLISNTDNHHVIVVRDGVVVTEITGFNNPVTAVLF
ncbi:PQQ-binding-like beta-propeller repeat protein [Hoeflea sp.]|uniref:PQQ-binding-like beta-propeller repeat protein n=1 Tax=Hoeflea sp. TaxID=1940281 RepID=UPI003A8E92C3